MIRSIGWRDIPHAATLLGPPSTWNYPTPGTVTVVIASFSGHYYVLWWDGDDDPSRFGAHGGEQGGAGRGLGAGTLNQLIPDLGTSAQPWGVFDPKIDYSANPGSAAYDFSIAEPRG